MSLLVENIIIPSDEVFGSINSSKVRFTHLIEFPLDLLSELKWVLFHEDVVNIFSVIAGGMRSDLDVIFLEDDRRVNWDEAIDALAQLFVILQILSHV